MDGSQILQLYRIIKELDNPSEGQLTAILTTFYEHAQSLIPNISDTYTLGNANKVWKNIYTTKINGFGIPKVNSGIVVIQNNDDAGTPVVLDTPYEDDQYAIPRPRCFLDNGQEVGCTITNKTNVGFTAIPDMEKANLEYFTIKS